MISTQDDQQIGDHGSLALFIQFDNLIFIQPFECHFHHADCAVDNHFPRINDGGCLLTLEHDGGNFRRIGEIGNARFDDFQPCVGNTLLDLVADTRSDNLALPAQAAFICLSVARRVDIRCDIIRVQPDNVAQRTVALE